MKINQLKAGAVLSYATQKTWRWQAGGDRAVGL